MNFNWMSFIFSCLVLCTRFRGNSKERVEREKQTVEQQETKNKGLNKRAFHFMGLQAAIKQNVGDIYCFAVDFFIVFFFFFYICLFVSWCTFVRCASFVAYLTIRFKYGANIHVTFCSLHELSEPKSEYHTHMCKWEVIFFLFMQRKTHKICKIIGLSQFSYIHKRLHARHVS